MDWRTMDKKQLITFGSSILFVVFGILFCVLSQTMLGFIETAICLALIVYGAFFLLVYCLIDSDTRETKSVIKGVGAIAIGLLIIFIPAFFMSAIGAIIAGYNALLIARAKNMKESKIEGWKSVLISSITFTVLGVGLIVIAIVKVPSLVLMIYLGVTLILQGGYNLVKMYVADKKKNKIVFAEGDTSAIKTAESQAEPVAEVVEAEPVVEEPKAEEKKED